MFLSHRIYRSKIAQHSTKAAQKKVSQTPLKGSLPKKKPDLPIVGWRFYSDMILIFFFEKWSKLSLLNPPFFIQNRQTPKILYPRRRRRGNHFRPRLHPRLGPSLQKSFLSLLFKSD